MTTRHLKFVTGSPDVYFLQHGMTSVLILTAGFGEGHNTAARNLRDALQSTGSARAEIADIFAIAYGRLNELARRAYLTTINHAPAVWEKIYQLFDSDGSVEHSLLALVRMKRKLRGEIDRLNPDIILSTYPLYSFLLEAVNKEPGRRRVPLVTVVTDSITINSIWHRASSDFFVVPNDATADAMIRAGVDAGRIRAFGFPVTSKFDVPITRPAPSDQAGRRLLFTINFGRKEAPALVRQLLELPDLSLTVTVGRDGSLGEAVKAAAGEHRHRLEIFGWTDKLPDLMLSHHLLLSKAGGATVQESIAAQLPMIISQIVPGQEEGNARLLLENDCGAFAETPAAIVAAVRDAFASDAARWRTWTHNLARLRRADASRTIAEFALRHAAARP